MISDWQSRVLNILLQKPMTSTSLRASLDLIRSLFTRGQILEEQTCGVNQSMTSTLTAHEWMTRI